MDVLIFQTLWKGHQEFNTTMILPKIPKLLLKRIIKIGYKLLVQDCQITMLSKILPQEGFEPLLTQLKNHR